MTSSCNQRNTVLEYKVFEILPAATVGRQFDIGRLSPVVQRIREKHARMMRNPAEKHDVRELDPCAFRAQLFLGALMKNGPQARVAKSLTDRWSTRFAGQLQNDE